MIKIGFAIKVTTMLAVGLVFLIGPFSYPHQSNLTAIVDKSAKSNDSKESGSESPGGKWTASFMLHNCTFSSVGRNSYFILQPGYRTVYEGIDEGIDVRLTITVLNETKTINGIDTRIIEEKATDTKKGMIYEVSRNYFALCKENNSVFYFGEDVDWYENGHLVNHSGTWYDGINKSKAGLMMPGIALVGSRYYQETAPDVAIDRAEIMSLNETADTPAGKFVNCMKEKDTDGLDPQVAAYKYYAPGIGQVRDDNLNLVSYGYLN
jgi:hypothetical protein